MKKWRSAGGVVHDLMDKLYIYITLPSNGYGPWCLPKGRIEKGETEEAAAQREILEETGLKVKVGRKIGEGVGKCSITTYFECWAYAGNIQKHDEETEEVRRVTVPMAIRTFEGCGNLRDMKILEKYQQMIADDWMEGSRSFKRTLTKPFEWL